MLGMLIGCIANIILDPIFIFVFHWGVKGAAWATNIGQILTFIIYFVYIWKFKSVKIHKESFALSSKILKKIVGLSTGAQPIWGYNYGSNRCCFLCFSIRTYEHCPPVWNRI